MAINREESLGCHKERRSRKVNILGMVLPWWARWARWAVLAALVIAVGLTVWIKGVSHGEAKIQAKWDQEKLAQEQAYAMVLSKHIQAEADLKQQAQTQTGAFNAQVSNLRARSAALAAELLKRAKRPANGVPAPTAATGPACLCTGAQLYFEDADAFRGEAASAAIVGAERDDCVTRYHDAQKALTK